MFLYRNSNSAPSTVYSSKPFLLILVLAFAVRFYWVITQNGVIENEGGEYARLAENILAGKGYLSSLEEQPNLMYAPLYPILVSFVTYFARDSELAGRLVSVVSGALLTLPMYFIALRLYGRRTAHICAGLVALHPILVGFSAAVLTEAVYLTFMMAGVYWGLRCLELESPWICALAGTFFGLAYLTRPEAFALIVLTTVLIITLGLAGHKGLKRIVTCSSLLIASFVVLAIPYIGFLGAHTGKFILEAKSKLNYTIGTRFNTGMPYNQAAWGIGEDLAEEGPLRESYRYATFTPYPTGPLDIARYLLTTSKRNKQGVYETLVCSYAFGPILLGLGFLGWFGEGWSKHRLIDEMFIVAVLLFIVLLLLSAHLLQFRYFLPALPLLIIWASKGIEHLSEWAKSTASGLMGRVLPAEDKLVVGVQCLSCLVVVLVGLRGVGYVSELTQSSRQQYALKEAGLWLKQGYSGSKRMMTANSIAIPYYSQGIMMALPYADSSLALKYIYKKNPNLVVLEGRTMRLRPYIRDWLERGIPDPSAHLIYSKGNSIEDKIAIFKFDWASASN
jgi:4-amino-4-deoxy-L-arabinose transferase-like glycosyltransferase